MHRDLLVLDDDELVGAYIRRFAEGLGIHVRVTQTVESFRARLNEAPPTDIILDLQLGAQDGVEVLRMLAAADCSARIVLLSGFDDRVLGAAHDLGRSLGLVIPHALTKPVRGPALQAALTLEEPTVGTVTIADLKAGIDRGELVLEYQPIVNLHDGEVRCIEALVRWRRSNGARVPPSEFIPLAEQNPQVMDALTVSVAETAARDWRTLVASGWRTQIAVNISAQNLRWLDFPERMAKIVERAGMPAAQMKLEVTETAAMADPQVTLDILLRLRLKGFSLAVDDFGTGYTSIAMLQRLPFSELKVDRSFIAEISASDDALCVAKGVIALGRSMQLATVAEGVETQEVLDILKTLGCDAAQGYLISRPLALDRLLLWFAQRRPDDAGSAGAGSA